MNVNEEMVQIFKIHILCVVICITVNCFISFYRFKKHCISLLCSKFWSFFYKVSEDDFEYSNRVKLLIIQVFRIVFETCI